MLHSISQFFSEQDCVMVELRVLAAFSGSNVFTSRLPFVCPTVK